MKGTSKPNKPTGKPAAQPFVTTDREAAFRHFHAQLKGKPAPELEPWHWDAEIVRVNAERAAAAIASVLDAHSAKLPNVSMNELREMPTLGLALAFAASRVAEPASSQEIRERQRRQRPRRRLALSQLLILKELGLIADGKQVDAIVPGRGAPDEARDGVACVAVFRENAATIAGKHPFDDAWLALLAEDSNWLLGQLNVAGAARDKAAKSAEATDRDVIYTELVRRHGEGKKVAVEEWGWKHVDEHYPALLSREVAPPAPTPAPTPTPTPGPTK